MPRRQGASVAPEAADPARAGKSLTGWEFRFLENWAGCPRAATGPGGNYQSYFTPIRITRGGTMLIGLRYELPDVTVMFCSGFEFERL